jgi:hypothetical protein
MCIWEKIITSMVVFILFSPSFIIDNYVNDRSNDCSFGIDNNYEHAAINEAEQSLTYLPHAFTENRGQLNNKVRFYEQGGGVWFSDSSVWFEFRDERSINSQLSSNIDPESIMVTNDWRTMNRKYKSIVLKQEFIDSNQVQPIGKKQLDWNNNYFYGNDSKKWYTNVPNYAEIYYENLYDGIDLRYYTDESGLKYDLIVHPGVNPEQIKIKWKGAERLDIHNHKDLIIETPIKNIIDGDLFIYQINDGYKNSINGKFKLINSHEYGFDIQDDYDTSKNLIIDPIIKLEYSTYIGGTNAEVGNEVVVDTAGNAIITGYTKSTNFPTTAGAKDITYNGGNYDVFVFKLNPDGSKPIFSTFIGGGNEERGYDIDIDSTGNTYITGFTQSSDFPTTASGYDTSHNGNSDVFVFKLNSNGSTLIYSTFIGDINAETGWGITIDSLGNAFVTGNTGSLNFPTTIGAYSTSKTGNSDIFVLKLNQTGSKLLYSTYIGGSSFNYGISIDVDSNGNAFITGSTQSSNFPVSTWASDTSYNGGLDGFVLKLNKTGSKLLFSTYIGGSNHDRTQNLIVDGTGNALIIGYTWSSTFPTTKGAYDRTLNGSVDAYIVKFNHNGSKLIFSTFLGGNSNDEGYDIDIDSQGNVYSIGLTRSTDFPVTQDAYDTSIIGQEVFVTKLDQNGSAVLYSTFIGGSGDEGAQGLIYDSIGNVYVTGYTSSLDFPNSTNAWDNSNNGGGDIFVLKLSFRKEINITSVLLLKENVPIDSVYSKLCPYNFRINLYNTVLISDLNNVHLNLDPFGDNIQLQWDQLTGQFIELSDPNDHVNIDLSSKAKNYFYWWTLDFNLTFNWTYPNEDFQDIQVFATSKTLSPAWFNASDFYRVENDLVFVGNLSVKGDNNRIINEYDLIRGGEVLNWSGLIPVYENTTDVYPNEEEFDVIVVDQNGEIWRDSPNSGLPFHTQSITPKTTHNESFTYIIKLSEIPSQSDRTNRRFTIRLSKIPPESDKTNESYRIMIDADNVSFSNAIPSNTTWQTNKDVIVGINITDIGGGLVDSNTVMYSISRDNGNHWTDWKLVLDINSNKSIIINKLITLNEGIGNFIKWKAMDSLGNGPNESIPYRILIDTNPIQFTDPRPLITDISKTKELELSITISDINSGVDAFSIEYSVSHDKGKTWNEWQSVVGYENGSIINVKLNHTFPNGTNNMIKWRASDIAGNGPTESQSLVVNVNTWVPIIRPEVTLLSPPQGITINRTDVELKWELDDSTMENVTYDVFFDNVTPPNIEIMNITETNLVINDLVDGEIYYWNIIPRIGELKGSSNNGVWWFKVNLDKTKPIINYKIEITGRKNITLYPNENKSIELIITNLGNVPDIIRIDIKAGKLSEYLTLNDYSMIDINSNDFGYRILNINLSDSIEPGIYEIIVTAISINSGEREKDNHIVTIEVLETIKPKPADEKEKTDQNLLWILILIIIIIIVIITTLILKHKKRIDQEILPAGALTIKPGGLTAPVISVGEIPETLKIPQLSGTVLTRNGKQSTVVSSNTPVSTTSLPSKPLEPQYQLPKATLSKVQRLELLEERFLRGEVTEETYKELKTKIEAHTGEDITKVESEEQSTKPEQQVDTLEE